MSAPFRDDRDALLARAASLEEENDVLRAEIAKHAPGTIVARPDARLSRDALERLDRMRRDIELAPEPAPHAHGLHPSPHPPARTGGIVRVVDGELARVRHELDALRRSRGRVRLWLAIVFAIGVVLGAVLARAR